MLPLFGWATVSFGAVTIERVGVVGPEGPDHVLVPFEVPDGIVEIQVEHTTTSVGDVLDWGLDDPEGFRGWGGGNVEDAMVGVQAASRSYVPGPMPSGTWSVVIGRAKLASPEAGYQLRITLRSAEDGATLAAQPERRPYADVAPLATGWAWYAGDLHVHSRESGDASPTVDAAASAAELAGLDFLVLTEHNTDAHLTLLGDAQTRTPVLLVPGIEWTSYDGHAGLFGATAWVNHRVGLGGWTAEDAFAAARAQGALPVVNHPSLDLGDLCIGCAWDQPVDPAGVAAIEVLTGGWAAVSRVAYGPNLALWESWLDAGARVAAVGGSDDHAAGDGSGPTYSPIGSPTTRLLARELSVPALREALAAGRTMVQLRGASDPVLRLEAEADPLDGSDVPDDRPWTATVEGAEGLTLQWIVQGAVVHTVAVTADPFVDVRSFDAPPSGLRVRLALVDGDTPRVLTGYRWLADVETPSTGAPDGCGCAAARGVGFGAVIGALALAWGRRR
ncbi:MAG: hypothetical protein RLZZ383_2674 [Pseudomonadota bacterium]